MSELPVKYNISGLNYLVLLLNSLDKINRQIFDTTFIFLFYSIHKYLMKHVFAGEISDPDCFCKTQPALFLQAVDMEKKRKAEDISGNILGLYK